MKIFGRNAILRPDVRENCLHRLQEGSLAIQVLRWEISDFQIDGLSISNGHILSFRITVGEKEFNLFQHVGVFYVQEDSLPIEKTIRRIPQGDGRSSPRWHKCDRVWPAKESKEFDFVAQFYFGEEVAYLFRDEREEVEIYAIFKDHLNRQDAEEHYRLEAEQGDGSDVDR